MKKNENDDLRFAYYDLDEMYQYQSLLIPLDTRETTPAQLAKEGTIPIQSESSILKKGGSQKDVIAFRKLNFPQRVYRIKTQINKNATESEKEVERKGDLLVFHSESAYSLFKTGLTFNSEGKQICFLHDLKNNSEIPSDIVQIFNKIQILNERISDLNATNKSLEIKLENASKSQGISAFTEKDINKIKYDTFKNINNSLGKPFMDLAKNANELFNKPNKTDLEKNIISNFNAFKESMINISKQYIGMKQE